MEQKLTDLFAPPPPISLPDTFSPSHIEGSFTSVGRPGHCQSPVLAIENVDICQPILLDVSFDSIHVSQFRSSSRHHAYHHVQYGSGGMAFISTPDMSIPAKSFLHQVCCHRLNCCCSLISSFLLCSHRLTPCIHLTHALQ